MFVNFFDPFSCNQTVRALLLYVSYIYIICLPEAQQSFTMSAAPQSLIVHIVMAFHT